MGEGLRRKAREGVDVEGWRSFQETCRRHW